jgi:hypothetical protein
MIQMFYLFQTYAAFKCFMLQVFDVVRRVRGTVSDGRTNGEGCACGATNGGRLRGPRTREGCSRAPLLLTRTTAVRC